MLQRPDIPDESIISCLQDEYRLPITRIELLPIGVDQRVAVYRADTSEGRSYFVKLREGDFNEGALLLLKFLSGLGIEEIIPPLETFSGELWKTLGVYRLVLFRFVEGRDAYETRLKRQQWQSLGKAVKSVHIAKAANELQMQLPTEKYSPRWRDMVRRFLEKIKLDVFEDPVAQELSQFLTARSVQVYDLVLKTERLAVHLSSRSIPFVLNHGDLHAGNLFIGGQRKLYIVDWDEAVFAPKERDLMFVGGGLWGTNSAPEDEERYFYCGYGAAEVDPAALVYYRYERIIQDIAVFSEQILSIDQIEHDRRQALHYLKSSFDLNGVLDIAYRTEKK
jgi:spectinomycin phosphotransferase